MLLVFWVLWRLRWLNARETFAAVRLPIPGAVPSSAAVMAFYLRSFEADKLNEGPAAERPRCKRRRAIGPMHPRDLCYRLRSVTGSQRLGLKPAAAQADCIAAALKHGCSIRAAAVVFEDL